MGLTFGCLTSFGQQFSYTFQLVDISEPGEAKLTIDEIRELLGVTVIKFNDDSDRFEILTHLDYDLPELTSDLAYIGLVLVGEITKVNIE